MPRTPVKLITWGKEYKEALASMGVSEGEHSKFIQLLILDALRRYQAGDLNISVVDAMLKSDTSVSEKAGRE